jgi:hypothetical protein
VVPIMKYTLLCAILISVTGFSQDRTGTFQFKATKERHTAVVTFRVEKFNPQKHRISGLDNCEESGEIKIDGLVPLGVDCTMPDYEVEIPKSIYSNCYQPPFPQEHISDYFRMEIGDDLRSVFVFMSGGDAAGSYQVIWVLRTDGMHSRFSQGVPDSRFIDFGGFSDNNVKRN